MSPVSRRNPTALPAYGFDFADKTLGFFLIRAIGEEDIDTAPRKIDGGVAAQAAASTRDDGDLIRHDCAPLLA